MELERCPVGRSDSGIEIPEGSLLLEQLLDAGAFDTLPAGVRDGFAPMSFWPDALALTAPPEAVHLAILEDYDDLLDCDGAPLGGEPIAVAEALEVLAGWHRQAARAQAKVSRWSALLARRQVPRDVGFRAADRDEVAASEIALRLGISPRQAAALVAQGHALQGLFAPVAELADAGLLDAAKTAAFTQELADVPVEAAIAVMEQVLPEAPHVPAWQLRKRLQRELVRLDPAGEAERARCAQTRRRVNPPRPAGSGMAMFSALLPAVVAHALDQVCESAGRAARAAGDPDDRNLDQIRADVLATLAEHALVTGQVGAVGVTSEVFTFDPRRAKVRITATRAHQQGRAGVSVVDTIHSDLDNAEPSPRCAGSARPSSDDDGDAPDNRALPNPSATPSPAPFATPTASGPPRPCVPGLDIPELEGFGALPPATVADLVGLPWVQVREPVTPGEIPAPSDSYRIPTALDRYVRARDGTCQAPGCDIPASRCDVDHVIEWPAGPTAAWNLRCLCRHHHRLKTHGGHRFRHTSDGGTEWITPAGQRLRRAPDGRSSSDAFVWRQHREDPGDEETWSNAGGSSPPDHGPPGTAGRGSPCDGPDPLRPG